ncbi:MAG: amino acid adenylation domain-containing protein [Bacteroidota bacterium]
MSSSTRHPHHLGQLIDQAAERLPNQIAFKFGKQSMTYAQMREQTSALAGLLHSWGIEKGDRVGIYLPRSLKTAIAVHGCLKAGTAFVPLDPSAPLSRIASICKNCGIRALVTNDRLGNKLVDQLGEDHSISCLIGLESEGWTGNAITWGDISEANMPPPNIRILADDLAYIMYTSGSTGQPKGIMHTHRSGLAYAKLSAELYGLTSQDVVGNHCALHYDISTFGYFTAPLVGATTIIVSDAHTKFPMSLVQMVSQEKISVWYSVPLALIQMLNTGKLLDFDFDTLRWVLFGGEVFPSHLLAELMHTWPKARFSNVYGPAEVNQCTYHHLDTPPPEDEPIPLGRVWPNTEILIVDQDDQPVVDTEIGLLLVRSATMMRGYWQAPELNNKAFYRREVVPGMVETFYRTGDLVSCTSAGSLLFHGRADRQIKTRGFRVELESVEQVLNAIDEVAEGVVYPISKGDEGLLIYAQVILKNAAQKTPKELIQIMAADLPPHALPAEIALVDRLPRTAAGKIDRKALAESHATTINL